MNFEVAQRIHARDRRRDEDRDHSQKQHAGLQTGIGPVELLHMVLQSAEQERRAQHEQRIGDDHAGDRCLHQHILPRAQRGQRNDELGQIAEGGVEQAADAVARFGRHGFGGVAEQRSQRNDGQDGQQKQQRVRVVPELLDHKQDGHKGEQPQQRIVTDLFEQGIHRIPRGCGSFRRLIGRSSALTGVAASALRPSTARPAKLFKCGRPSRLENGSSAAARW